MNSDLSPEQKEVVETWGQGMAVLAGAGSGKTTTLVAKCVRLMELKPGARFAAVSFTERSAGDLRAKLSESLGLSLHWVTTIHGLCRSIIREFPQEAGFEGEETVLSAPETTVLWERALSMLWFDDIPEEIRISLERLLDRETRTTLDRLLTRFREISSFPIFSSLQASDDPDGQALAQVGRYVVERYERLKRRRGVLDFNDLEQGALRALREERVRTIFHRRFDLVLVDEFQDTNALQAQLLWQFGRKDLSNICVVGDPKQSIYRFRDADVSVFEEYCAALPIRCSLTWNFRSRPGIIQLTNQICGRVFSASEMHFDPLIPKRMGSTDSAGKTRSDVIRLNVADPHELADWILNEVKNGVPLHEMTLLVRRVRGKEKWFKALRARGIPVAVSSGGLFWEDPRVRELVAFLKWWDNPGNSLSGGVFLRAPWMKISDEELDRWVQIDPTWKAPFFASLHPLAQALKKFQTSETKKEVRPGELLLEFLTDEAIEAELGTQLLSLWHRIEEFTGDGLDFHAVVEEVSRAVEEGRRERDVPAPRQLGQLSVLTLHGSKGLEFPNVILIDLGEKPKVSDTPLLFWDREQGAYLGRRDAQGERDLASPQENRWRDLEKRKNLAESKRLFYVALTRARERLILVCSQLSRTDKAEVFFDPEQAVRQDDWRSWVECYGGTLEVESLEKPPEKLSENIPRNLPTELLKNLEGPASFSDGPLRSPPPRMTRARHSVTEWTLLSRCPRAYEWTYIRPVGLSSSQKEKQKQGILVHQGLERGQVGGPDAILAQRAQNWISTSPWMKPTDPASGRRVWTELSFEVPVEHAVLVGSMDRLVKEKREEKSFYQLIDFKVSNRPKSNRKLIETYRIQMQLYAWALQKLDPQIDRAQIEAVLVHLSPEKVQIVSVPLNSAPVQEWLQQADAIINGSAGEPRPSFQCQYCPFLERCFEGRDFTYRKSISSPLQPSLFSDPSPEL